MLSSTGRYFCSVGEVYAESRVRRRRICGLSWLFVLRGELSVATVFAQCGWRACKQGELAADFGWAGAGVGSAGVQALPEQVVVGGCEAG